MSVNPVNIVCRSLDLTRLKNLLALEDNNVYSVVLYTMLIQTQNNSSILSSQIQLYLDTPSGPEKIRILEIIRHIAGPSERAYTWGLDQKEDVQKMAQDFANSGGSNVIERVKKLLEDEKVNLMRHEAAELLRKRRSTENQEKDSNEETLQKQRTIRTNRMCVIPHIENYDMDLVAADMW